MDENGDEDEDQLHIVEPPTSELGIDPELETTATTSACDNSSLQPSAKGNHDDSIVEPDAGIESDSSSVTSVEPPSPDPDIDPDPDPEWYSNLEKLRKQLHVLPSLKGNLSNVTTSTSTSKNLSAPSTTNAPQLGHKSQGNKPKAILVKDTAEHLQDEGYVSVRTSPCDESLSFSVLAENHAKSNVVGDLSCDDNEEKVTPSSKLLN